MTTLFFPVEPGLFTFFGGVTFCLMSFKSSSMDGAGRISGAGAVFTTGCGGGAA